MDVFVLERGPVPVLRCAPLADVPGIAHGFSTRLGPGDAPFDLGAADAPAAVADRRAVFLRASGVAGEPLVLRQVHGAAVVHAAAVQDGEIPEGDAAVWLRREGEGRAPAVRTADCVPVLLADRKGTAVAAVHAGWRGTAARIAPAAVHALAARGVEAGDLVAALGPAILACCYAVGPEVATAVALASGQDAAAGHLDLHAALRRQLLAAGIPQGAIHAAPYCTRCRDDLFFSYRREGEGAGRLMAVIGRSS